MARGGHRACEGLNEGTLNSAVPGSVVGHGQVSEDDTDFPVRVRTCYTERAERWRGSSRGVADGETLSP